MKGIVFTELFDLVESNHGYEVVDRLIQNCSLTNDGAYSAVGTYDAMELVQIVGMLSQELDADASGIVKFFGRHLFGRFVENYSAILPYDNAFDLLKNVEGIIHGEVRKIYPDAELPTFTYQEFGDERFVMTYESTRPFADLCEGLIEACVEHFGDPVTILRTDLNEQGTAAQFELTKIHTNS